MIEEERLHRTWIHSERFVPTRFVQPIQRFFEVEAASGIIMLVAAVLAIAWANAPFGESYAHFWETNIAFEIGGFFHFEETLEAIVNDGLMAIFFFVVGLEIKREVVIGELRDPKAASLPLLGALGGMVFPALIYLAFAAGVGPEAVRGWGVPMATDIAFSLGVLSLLGKRVPTGAKLFLLALAIADDLGGILVIAVFYTSDLSMFWLAMAAGGMAAVALASKVGIRSHVFYVPMAIAVWYFVLESGVHATIAGVALALLTPVRPMYSDSELERKSRRIMETFPRGEGQTGTEHGDYEGLMLAEIARESVAPLTRLEHKLQWWSSFAIIPIFAVANAGVRFEGTSLGEALTTPIALGVALGLIVGKTIGISLFSWAAVKLRLAKLPRATNWQHMVGVAATAGIGFTVALFITALAFTDEILADDAKVGIFAGSLIAGIIGVAILRAAKTPDVEPEAPELPEGIPLEV